MFGKVVSKSVAIFATQPAAQENYRIGASETIVGRAEILDQTIAFPDVSGVPSPNWHSSYFEQPPSEARGRIPINVYGPAKHRPQTLGQYDCNARSLSGIRNHNLDLIVRAALRSAKSEAGTPALPHLFASERPQGPFSQPRHGFSLLIA